MNPLPSQLRVPAALVLASLSTPAWAAGGVQVEATEQGASIYIDGAETGMETPGTIMGLSDGRHIVTVRNGCYVGEAEVEITSMSVVPINITLEPGQGSITVQPVPIDAAVELDGELISGTAGKKQEVSCGPHSVQASMAGYLNAMITVDVEAGQHMVLPLELEKLGTGGLRVDVDPDGATVILDGRELGVGDQEVHGVVAGPHVLSATLTGFAAGEQQFILEDGDTLELSLALQPGGAAVASTEPVIPEVTKTPRERTPIKATKAVGYGLLALGTGAGVVAISQWSQGRAAYAEYLDRAAAVNAGEKPVEYATDYHEAEVKRFQGPLYGSSAAATVLLGSGVALAFVF